MNGEIKDYGVIKCMRAKINCETKNQGLLGKEAQELRRPVQGYGRK